ncbi:DUF2147 domain-containing protein [Oceanispirochaeta sp.]|jgi:uncharacterized protein (DUF2147 family)|uniref:DUF2147 domain-containing protein n=1 Tax=Oceanispirochaeta sp. TaxID=2035350 RepID=UPI00262E102A|nr:DUF2147 domain-containing protein [Oceanispirochaeta sp.]MDA3957300.1 DUF2147 domain-containing protein [Oceanispirochaeta sp.]
MSKKILNVFFILCFFAAPLMANTGILGLWKTVDDATSEVKSIVKVYEYQGKVFGRILVTFEDGKLKDTYVSPSHRAENVKGEPFYAGLDFIWDMEEKGRKWKKGKILDPQEGKVYSSEIWLEGGNLIVRGKIGPFGRNQTWLPATARDLPAGTSDPTNLVPSIPQ